VRRIATVLPASFEANALWGSGPSPNVVVHATGIEPSAWTVTDTALTLWAFGTAVAILILIVEAMKLARLSATADSPCDERRLRVAQGIAAAIGIERPLRLLQSDRAALPMAWGVRRPCVLLPSSATEWSEARTRVVLAHEMAHLRRGDWVVQLAAELACALYWFNPLFWIARNRLAGESERACDDVVLNLGVDGETYAAHLLAVAREAASGKDGYRWSPAVSMARRSHLEQRFAALLTAGVHRNGVRGWTAAAILATAVLLAVPIAAIEGVSGASIEVETTNLPVRTDTLPSLVDGTMTAVRQVRASPSWPRTSVTNVPEILEYTTPPLYSDEARARHVEGVVTVEARVDLQGTAHVVRVVKGLGFGLDQNALVALRQWRFVPATENGAPIAMDCEIDIEFSLGTEALNELIANDMATRVGPGVTPPRAVRTVNIPSIREQGPRGRRGTVRLDVVLLENGRPKIVRILQSVDPALDDRAVRAFEQWLFSPATKDGRPVKVRMQAEVTFHG
jgi:TonB family protein